MTRDLHAFTRWAAINLVAMLPAHLAATYVWTIGLYGQEGRPLSPAIIGDGLLWALFASYMLALLLGPTLASLAILWITRGTIGHRFPRLFALLLVIGVIWTVHVAWWTVAHGRPPDLGIYPINAVAWLIVYPAVFGLLIRLPRQARSRGPEPRDIDQH